MKKLLGILALTAMATSLFAQGTVTLGNQTGLVKKWTSSDTSTLISVPRSGGYVQLIAAPQGTALVNPLFTGNAAAGEKLFANYTSLSGFLAANPGWVGAWGPNTGTDSNPALIGLGAGLINGGTFTIPGIPAGGLASYAWISWSVPTPGAGALPNTFDTAMTAALVDQNIMMGLSAIYTVDTADPTTTPPGTPTNLKTTFGGMALAPVYVPEPSIFALAGLGIASLLVLRRRS